MLKFWGMICRVRGKVVLSGTGGGVGGNGSDSYFLVRETIMVIR